MLPVSALNTIGTQLGCHVPKKVVEKFSFSELKIEKVKFFYSEAILNHAISLKG